MKIEHLNDRIVITETIDELNSRCGMPGLPPPFLSFQFYPPKNLDPAFARIIDECFWEIVER